MKFFAVQFKRQLLLPQTRTRISNRLPCAAIPNDDRTRPIFALWNGPFEAGVLDRMVLDLDCQPFLPRVKTRTFRNCPTLQHAVEFQAEIVMQSSGVMLLNDEKIPISLR